MRRLRMVPLLLVPLLSGPAAVSQEAPAETIFEDVGAKRILMVRQLTAVYPASGDEATDRFRLLSARARARFLEAAMGIEIPVVADDRVTDEQKRGHLFLLGWDNRLLGTEEATLPFRKTEKGFEFLGIKEAHAESDLLFCHRSPYDPSKVLYFWSRIDPELDRFLVVPTLGSDWAIYRNYLPVRQGMFVADPRWPPKRDLRAEKDHAPDIARILVKFREKATEHYDIHYDPSVVSPDELEFIARARETAFARAAKLLGTPRESFRVRLYVYDDEEQKKTLTNVEDPAHGIDRELHLVRRVARSETAHEEFHLIARDLYGPGYLTSLYEGVAVAGDGSFRDLAIDVHGARLLDRGQLPTLKTLLDEEALRRLPVTVLLPASALMVSWLRDTYGEDAFRGLYSLLDGTPEGLAGALDASPSEIEKGFRTWVERAAASRNTDLAFLNAEARARERQLLGDYAGVARALQEALRHRPDDPQTLFNLAAAQMRTREYDEAEANLRRLLASTLPTPVSHLRIFAHYQLGRLFDVQGRREDALGEYARVLELPDRHGAHRLANEAIEHPVTPEQLE